MSAMAASAALLPEGLRDTLPPHADMEAVLLDRLFAVLSGNGYERVRTPLAEFDRKLVPSVNPGGTRTEPFQFMDPASRRRLNLRADITPQVSRLAATRLAQWPRPLRLSYSGPVLRVKGSQIRADREFLQVGAELIGSAAPPAVREVILLAVDALKALGLQGIALDLVTPDLLTDLAASEGLGPADTAMLLEAFDTKDAGALEALPAAATWAGLLDVVGPLDRALEALQALALPETAQESCGFLAAVARDLPLPPDVGASFDPGELRGFEFQHRLGFSLFADGVRGEVARGGCYFIDRPDGSREPAVGFSIYLNGIVDAVEPQVSRRRLLVPATLRPDRARALIAEGWIVVRSLTADASIDEARAQRCGHRLQKDQPVALTGAEGE